MRVPSGRSCPDGWAASVQPDAGDAKGLRPGAEVQVRGFMLWGEGHIQTTTMEIQPFNQKQRDVFARMLVQAKERAQAELESDDDLSRRVENEVIPKLVEERGARELVARFRKLRKEAGEAEEALDALGFHCSDDRITLRWNAPKAINLALEAAKRSARKENQKSLKKFDLAILGVWAAETADDARKIVEGLL